MYSEGAFGTKANEIGWGTRGAPEQRNGRGGGCKTNCGDEGLLQTLVLPKTTSDSLEDVGLEGTVSPDVELVRESSSYMHSLRKV